MYWWEDQKYKKSLSPEFWGECPLLGTCEYVNTENCVENCGWYHSAKRKMVYSNLPPRYQKNITLTPYECDLEAFVTCERFARNILRHIDAGHGLYLYSRNKGNGKTSWVAKIIQSYIYQSLLHDKEYSFEFIQVADFFMTLRDAMDGTPEKKELASKLTDRILNRKLVIFDDIGAERGSGYVAETLFTLYNRRYNNNMSTIFTSNLSMAELELTLGEQGSRMVDRMNQQCQPIEFKGLSERSENQWWNTK